MTRVHGDPEAFVDDALEGFARVHADLVRRVEGGIVRVRPLDESAVAVVVGGGSGHYPAFAGLVGEGLAAGAVCGNIFSSPSSRQAVEVARAVEAGGGILFSFGNYAGDVIHFGAAERELRDHGIDARTVLVTDDIASAPADAAHTRRGIAGDLCVFRIAGAAAQEGADLDEVERLARHANDRTRTLGVAFAGCTLPGAGSALFTVPEGMMSVGLGIHGEPGVRDVPIQAAPQLATTLIEPLLAERPDGAADRAVLIVNGLGTVKYEELFVLYRFLSDRLCGAGVEIVAPMCGELVTSLDMAGVSVTLLWVDDELERLWTSPVRTPALSRGPIASPQVAPSVRRATPEWDPPAADGEVAGGASVESVRAAATALALIQAARDVISDRAEELGDLDAIAGDGDHGIGMLRGLDAALSAARGEVENGVSVQLRRAGNTWADRAGGTSGALWGAAIEALADALAASPPDEQAVAEGVHAARERIQRLGGAAIGDKTLVDALAPFDDAFALAVAGGADLREAVGRASAVARRAADGTAALTPRLGRARPLAERSLGHPDPGAVSFAIIVETLAAHVREAD